MKTLFTLENTSVILSEVNHYHVVKEGEGKVQTWVLFLLIFFWPGLIVALCYNAFIVKEKNTVVLFMAEGKEIRATLDGENFTRLKSEFIDRKFTRKKADR